jgi:hypothetical protein
MAEESKKVTPPKKSNSTLEKSQNKQKELSDDCLPSLPDNSGLKMGIYFLEAVDKMLQSTIDKKHSIVDLSKSNKIAMKTLRDLYEKLNETKQKEAKK